jgi:tetratricopeptide (TPR) repeat protein
MMNSEQAEPATPQRKVYVRAVGPRLRLLLNFIFGLVAVLGANSLYLSSITYLEWLHRDEGLVYQNYFFQLMFLGHLVLGLLLVLPFVLFGILHIRNAHDRPNRRAVRVGYGLFAISLVVLFTGVALMRFDFFSIKDPRIRSPLYWAHVITPLLALWLYILHRLAGPRIKWAVGLRWTVALGVLVVSTVFLHSKHPRKSQIGSVEGKKYFEPSLARTASGNFIPARTLMMDDYCLKCHADAYQGWLHSAHHFSSFNNQPYLFSIRETRAVALARDGNVKASRWCAGCHDVVPFFSGAFDDPNFDLEKHPTSQAGITCTSCHAITHINSTVGNADYTIDEPIHYPFAYSTNKVLQFINQQLVKAKPEFHKKTFLKPFMRTEEFCSVCHKVSLPVELTHYKDFLRGQNHYDTYLLSGVSGHGARSFYYPDKAKPNCAACHMPLQASADFGAKFFDGTNVLSIHSHLFPAANTGVAHLRGEPDIVKAHQEFLKGSVRVDLFGLKEGGAIDGKLIGPLRPQLPALKRGQKYLLEAVVRTVRLGHPFTQGTADSNEVWVDANVTSGDRVLGRSGGLGPHREVDPWSHFINIYMLDRNGNRIDRRNPQDIFTPLYNHQIPPGAGQVVHYSFTVPDQITEPLKVEIKVQYRKFDTIYMNYVLGQAYSNGAPFQITNDLPITTIASDTVAFPIEGLTKSEIRNPKSEIPEWQRWNDYGIGLFLESTEKGSEKGELIQAAHAFTEVEKLGRADGPVNLARVYFREGRLDDAVAALQRATKFNPPAPRWTVAWFNGLVNKQNGYLDKAITEFRSILEDRYPELDQRGFDFSKDYEVINELGQTLFERAKVERGEANKPQREKFLRQAEEQFKETLALDPENLTAHYNLQLIYEQLGDSKLAAHHRALHERYRPDDNARDRAVAIARRRDPAADHAAQAIVIYPLQRAGAPELSGEAIPSAATLVEKSPQ